MTDDRAERLTKAILARGGDIATAALAAIDADPAAYGYRKINPPGYVTLSDEDIAYIRKMNPR